jgi:hypothetical protein
MGTEEHQRRRSTVAGERWRWRARAEWRELDDSCGKRSERLLLRTDSEVVRCTGAAACAARGAEVAACRQRLADSSTLRWRRPRSYRACDASVRAPARGVAHGVAAACATRGGRGGQVATVGGRSHDRGFVRTRVGRCRFERVGTVALGRAQSQFQTVFLINQIASTLCNSDSLPSLIPKIFKLCKGLDLNVMNNFVHWLNFQFPLYLLI